jgi:hypothetical protein
MFTLTGNLKGRYRLRYVSEDWRMLLKFILLKYAPNIVVGWLTLLFRIREVPGLNLGPETVQSFCDFP